MNLHPHSDQQRISARRSRAGSFAGKHLAGMAILFALIAGFVPQALAHAVLQKSNPSINAKVPDAASLPIELTFNSRIDAGHSKLSLMSAADPKPMMLTVDQKAQPNVLRSVATGLKPGHYQLQWQVVASDGHISRGVVPFDVR